MTEEATLFDSLPRLRFAKYRPDQARDEEGQWQDEGKGSEGSGGSGLRTAGLLGAGLLGGAALSALDRYKIGPALRAANRRAQRRRVAREGVARGTEATRMRDRVGSATMGKPGTRTRRVTEAMERANARLDRKLDRALDRSTARLPPKARATVRRELSQRGGHTPFDPAGKLIELPHWLWPF